MRMMPKLMTKGLGKPLPNMDESSVKGAQFFQDMSWSDWEEAQLLPVLIYLRGSTSLAMTPEWKSVFPTAL